MDNLISRADAIAVVRYCKEDPIKNLEALPGVGWIPVTERLPGIGVDVLCYFHFEPESPDVICQNTHYGGGIWLSEGSKVTHWMPLPEPPKEGE